MSVSAPTGGSCPIQGLEFRSPLHENRSTTSQAIDLFSKSFSIAGPLIMELGDVVRASSEGTPGAWVQGFISSIVGTGPFTVDLHTTSKSGSGTKTDWLFSLISKVNPRIGYRIDWTTHGDGTEFYEWQWNDGTGWSDTIASSGVVSSATIHGLIPSTSISPSFRVRANASGTPTSWLNVTGPGVFGGALVPGSGDLSAPLISVVGGARTVTAEVTSFGFKSVQDTTQSHWTVRLTRTGFSAVDYVFPWERFDSLVIEDLIPGQEYSVQVASTFIGADGVTTTRGDFGPSSPLTASTDAETPAITGPSSVAARAGAAVVGTFTFVGGGVLDSWEVDGATGLTITPRESPSTMADLGGTVAPGIYDVTVAARSHTGSGAMMESSLAVTLLCRGGSFLDWLHDDPLRADLQLDQRSRQLTSHTFDLAGVGLRLVLEQSRKLHVIFRDGARIIDDLPTAMRLTIRPADQYDAEPLLEAEWDSGDTEALGGADRAFFTLTPTGDELEAIFAALNAAEDAQPGSASIEGRIAIVATFSGGVVSSIPAKAIIAQSYNL